jgi:hypothetical protein
MQMDNSDKDKLKDVLASIDPIEFKWDETNTTVGVIAQEISSFGGTDTITLTDNGTIDLSSITTMSGLSVTGHQYATAGAVGNISFNSNSGLSAGNTEYGKTTIKTAKNTIDIDELADMMNILKKRLLILTPKFEMHEKYPMLQEMYNEYKAMEALLSGPDSNE